MSTALTGPLVLVAAGVALAAGARALPVVAVATGRRLAGARMPASLRRSTAGRTALVQLGLIAAVQVTVLAVALVALPAGSGWRWTGDASAARLGWLVCAGVLLGVLEAVLASTLFQAATAAIDELRRPGTPVGYRNWLQAAYTGSLRPLLRVVDDLPVALALPAVAVALAVEEVAVRGLVVAALGASAPWLTVPVAFALSILVRTASGTGPAPVVHQVCVALVVAPVHVLLLLAVPVVLPLVVAQLSYFAFQYLL